MKSLLIALALLLLGNFAQAADQFIKADASSADAACAADAAKYSCGPRSTVEKGLWHCFHDYHKAHHAGYHPAAACSAALEKMHLDKQSEMHNKKKK
jgi:hypothetical protein